MLVYLNLFISIVLPVLAGFLLLILIFNGLKFSISVSLAVAYGLGMGILGQVMLFLDILQVSYTRMNTIIGMLTVITIFGAIALFRRRQTAINKKLNLLSGSPVIVREKFTKLERIFFGGGAIIVIYYIVFIFWETLYFPVIGWDSLATSVFNAKIFFTDRSLEKISYVPWSIYPIQMPLILVWISSVLGGWNDHYSKIIFPLYFFSFCIIFFSILRYLSNKKWALMGLFLIFSSNLVIKHAAASYRDIMFMYYTSLTVMFLVVWKDQDENGFLYLAGLFNGFATFTKIEGTAYLPAHLLLLLYVVFITKDSFKKRVTAMLRYLIPCLMIFLFFYFYKILHGISTMDFAAVSVESSLLQVFSLAEIFLTKLFMTANWNICWFILAISLAYNLHLVRKNVTIRLFLLALTMFLGTLFGVSLLSGISQNLTSPFTISRLFMHVFPLVVGLIILLNFQPMEKESH